MRYFVLLLLASLSIGCSAYCKLNRYDLNEVITEVKLDRFVLPHNRKETIVSISLLDSLPEGIHFSKLYFQKQVAELKQKNPKLFYAQFKKTKSRINLSSDPNQEYGNTLQRDVQPPIPIDDSYALVEYTVKDKTKYYVLSKLYETPTIIHPGVIAQ